MKRLIYLVFVLTAAYACQYENLVFEHGSNEDLYASVEQILESKTSMDENNNVLWSGGDQLVAFMKTTLGVKYLIKEQYVGMTTGGFSKVEEPDAGDDLESGNDMYHNVVLYPYSSSAWCMNNDNEVPTKSYKLNVVLPKTQYYAENSFGNGAFPMLAVSEDNKLTFRNICGGLKLQFKGNACIKSIKVEGLTGELLSGKSTVVGYVNGSDPAISMAATANTSVTLDCGEGVQLSADTPTSFIIAVPPTTFASGLKITVTDPDGLSKTLTNGSSNTIKRSGLLKFPVITYNQEESFEFVEGILPVQELSKDGGIIEIPVRTNLDYEVAIPDNASDWITLLETKAMREERICLNVSENTTPEARSAVVTITAGGAVLQTIEINQEAAHLPIVKYDYVDEFGVNHGTGVEIDGTVWAPVNCGYHKDDFKYGKLYQWGRKYGQGYSGTAYVDGVSVQIKDAVTPLVRYNEVSLVQGQSVENENIYYMPSNTQDWTNQPSDQLWNSGTESEPVKTEYDPCPDGWRVPTCQELGSLGKSVMSTDQEGHVGFWFSGSKSYDQAEESVFFKLGGRWTYYGYADDRNEVGYYWSSRATSSSKAYYLLLYNQYISSDMNIRMYGCSVRCVQDNNYEIPEDSSQLENPEEGDEVEW